MELATKMTSYSQYNEDEIVAGCFPGDFVGNLLEIGAWSPTALSNSRMFIEVGWSAVLVEFSPQPVRDLVAAYADSPRVQVVQAAVTWRDDGLVKYRISDDALSTADPRVMAIWRERGGYFGNLWVPSLPLRSLVSVFFEKRPIDFASIDTEGTSVDLAVALMGFPNRPQVMCVEFDERKDELLSFAGSAGYHKVVENGTNVIICK